MSLSCTFCQMSGARWTTLYKLQPSGKNERSPFDNWLLRRDTAWCSCSNDNLIIPTVADSHNRCRKQWRSRAGSWEFADKRSNLCLVGKTISVVFSSLNIIKVRRIRLLVKTRIWNSSYSLWYVPFTRLMSFSIVEFWMYQCVRKLSTGIVAGEAYRCWESAWESNYAEFRSRVK